VKAAVFEAEEPFILKGKKVSDDEKIKASIGSWGCSSEESRGRVHKLIFTRLQIIRLHRRSSPRLQLSPSLITFALKMRKVMF